MTPIKLIGILGCGGLRMDFVAGWLGKHPDFVESHWNIDPNTRQSIGVTSNVVDLSSQYSLSGFLESGNYLLDSNAKLKYATKLHHFNPCYQTLLDQGLIEIFEIDYDESNLGQIYWEFIIKTFGRFVSQKYYIDKIINKNSIVDQDRIEKLENMLRSVKLNLHNTSGFTKLTFSKLFAPGGSKYLCDTIGITAGDYLHSYWDFMLPFSRTPDTVELWGKIWRKQDYFN